MKTEDRYLIMKTVHLKINNFESVYTKLVKEDKIGD
jgi:hypothetical protein